MTILQSIIIAIVEGLTEFLPVSSTGHMMLTEGVLRMQSDEYLKAFTVMIQFGAILSVLVLYFPRFIQFTPKPSKQQDGELSGWALYGLVLLGCIPAGVLGLLLNDHIDSLLGNLWVVVLMLFVGGVLMIYMDRCFSTRRPTPITPKKAIIIGLYQCLAMIPGTSRSMVTILGGMQQGLTRKQAAEYSFFLALPIMFGATLKKAYDLYKVGGSEIFTNNWQTLLLGNVVAFVVALISIKVFIGIVSRYGFKGFGYYRIAIALIFAALMLMGVPISLD